MEVESRHHIWWYDDHLWNCDVWCVIKWSGMGVVCFQMINGSHGQQLHEVEHPKNARLCRVIQFGIMLLLRFLVERQKKLEASIYQFLNLLKNNLSGQSSTQKFNISFFQYNACFLFFSLKGLQLLIFIFILYDLLYTFECN